MDDKVYEKEIIISDGKPKITPYSVYGGVFTQLKNIGSNFLQDNEIIESISVEYSDYKLTFLNREIHWLIIFFILTFISGFAIMKYYGIEW